MQKPINVKEDSTSISYTLTINIRVDPNYATFFGFVAINIMFGVFC